MTAEERARVISGDLVREIARIVSQSETSIARAIRDTVTESVGPGRMKNEPIDAGIKSVRIILEGVAGSTVWDAVSDAVRLVRRMQCPAEFSFNGLTVYVAPVDSEDDVMQRYKRNIEGYSP